MGSANGNISFLHALPRVLSLTLEKLLPLVCFPLSLQKWTPRTVHSIFKIQNPDFCKITSKTLPAFSPQSFKSLSCLPGDSASIVLFNLFEEMTRKRLNGFYCLIIIWSFVELVCWPTAQFHDMVAEIFIQSQLQRQLQQYKKKQSW